MDLRDKLLEVLGASSAVELTGGHQARVFPVRYAGTAPVIAKVVEAAGCSVLPLLSPPRERAALGWPGSPQVEPL